MRNLRGWTPTGAKKSNDVGAKNSPIIPRNDGYPAWFVPAFAVAIPRAKSLGMWGRLKQVNR